MAWRSSARSAGPVSGPGAAGASPSSALVAPGPPGLQGDPEGDAVEPAAERLDALEPAGLAGQREEGRLERVVGRVGVVQDPPAGTPDHRPVPPDEGRERRLGPGITLAPGEPAKQLGVGPLARGAVAEEPDQILADPADSRVDHGRGPPLPWTYPSESPRRLSHSRIPGNCESIMVSVSPVESRPPAGVAMAAGVCGGRPPRTEKAGSRW